MYLTKKAIREESPAWRGAESQEEERFIDLEWIILRY